MTAMSNRAQLGTWTPPLLELSKQRIAFELRSFWRVREEVMFTFSLPIILLTLFSTIFNGEIEQTSVDVSQYFVGGMLAATGLTVGFQSLAGQLALEQDDGTLKRLAGTPMPKAAYVIGKVGLVVIVALVQMTTMFAAGVLLFDVQLPDRRGWLILAAVQLLSLATWTMLGMAFSRIIRNPRAGAAVSVPPALVLQFISGVYIYFGDIPGFLRDVASVFPLRWTALGMRQALLPDEFAVAEPGGAWQTTTMFVVLLIWLGLSALAAGTLFRWQVRE